jgi:hypothetical protein
MVVTSSVPETAVPETAQPQYPVALLHPAFSNHPKGENAGPGNDRGDCLDLPDGGLNAGQ